MKMYIASNTMVSRRDLWNYEPPLTDTIHKEILLSISAESSIPGRPDEASGQDPTVKESLFPSRGKVYEVSLTLGGTFNKSLEEACLNITRNLSTLYAIVIVFADPFSPKTHNRVKTAVSRIASLVETEDGSGRKVEVFVNPMKRGWRCQSFERSCEKMGVSITINFLENSMIKSGWTDLPSRREPRNFLGSTSKRGKASQIFRGIHLCLWGTMGQGYGWYPPKFLESLTQEIFLMSRRYKLTKVFIDFRIRPYYLFSSPLSEGSEEERKPYFCLPALELKRPMENDFANEIEEHPTVVSPIYGDPSDGKEPNLSFLLKSAFPRKEASIPNEVDGSRRSRETLLSPREQEYLNFLLPQDSSLKISVWVIIKEWLLVLKMIDRRIP